eukprot:313644_1
MSKEESTSSKNRTKYIIPLLLGGAVALVIYATYAKRQSNKQKNASSYSNYSGTESLTTDWNNNTDFRIKVNASKVDGVSGNKPTTPSMKNIAKQAGFQKHPSRDASFTTMDESMSSIKSSEQDIYGQELTPAMPKTMRFTRRLSVPKMEAPKNFLGE